jgi:hypothetical protein
VTSLAEIILAGGSYSEQAQRVADSLRDRPARGVPEAVSFFEQASDADKARFAADYVGVLPDLRAEKTRLVDTGLERRELLGAVTLPLRGAGEDAVERAIAAYLADPDSEDTYAVAFEAAMFFPHLLRPHRDRLDDPDLRLASLPGAPDELTASLEAAYRDDPDPETLLALAKIRTDRALSALIDLRSVVPEHEHETLDVYIESSGVVPETGEPSVYFHTSRGFVVPRGEAPHAMGRGWGHAVPACPTCDTPGTRVLTLQAAALEFELARDPSFFWFSCDCDTLPYAVVRLSGEEPEGLMTPMADGEPDRPIVPDAALLLEEHPNQHGYGAEPAPGYAAHQVGGYVPWIRPDRNPVCPICARRARFLAAIDSGQSVFGPLRFKGMLLGFWCDHCAVSLTTRQTDIV